jgi:hypothetical protein
MAARTGTPATPATGKRQKHREPTMSIARRKRRSGVDFDIIIIIIGLLGFWAGARALSLGRC